MSFVVPNFNLPVNLWRAGFAVPPVGMPALTFFGNLNPGRRTYLGSYPWSQSSLGSMLLMYLLVPAHTDIRGQISVGTGDLVEVPAGSGRYYKVGWVDDVGKGFPNEHRLAVLVQASPWPTPLP